MDSFRDTGDSSLFVIDRKGNSASDSGIDVGKYTEMLHKCAESYFARYTPIDNHLRSFNDATMYEIPHLINSQNSFSHMEKGVEHKIQFTNIKMSPPAYLDNISRKNGYFPEESHTRCMAYSFDTHCTVSYLKNGVICQQEDNYQLVSIPAMVGSKLCNRKYRLKHDRHDGIPDGCFIIKDSMKILPPLKRAAWNLPMTRRYKDSISIEVRSCHDSRKSFSTYNTCLCLLNPGKNPVRRKEIRAKLSFFKDKTSISVTALFFVLGWTLEDAYMSIKFFMGDRWSPEISSIVMTLLTDNALVAEELKAIKDGVPFDPQKACMAMLVECSTRDHNNPDEDVIVKEFLPQVGIEESNDGDTPDDRRVRKCLMVATYVVELVLIDLGMKNVESRDDFRYVRMDSCGTLIAALFRQVYDQTIKQGSGILKKMVEKKGGNGEILFKKIVGKGKITARMLFCFSTGSWGSRRFGCTRKNVSQLLRTQNAQAMLGHASLLSTTRNSEGKHTAMRQIHATQIAKVCPTTTPEGKTCGIVNTGVCGFMLSSAVDPSFICEYIKLHPAVYSMVNWKTYANVTNVKPITINGTMVAFIDNSKISMKGMYIWMSKRRECLDIDPFTSLSYSDDSFEIHCDRDRIVRFVVKISEIPRLATMTSVMPSVMDLVSSGTGIIVDACEERVIDICASLQTENIHMYEYVEIDALAILSVLAGAIPYSNHNQGPRNTYQISMAKQAAGGFLNRNIIVRNRNELNIAHRRLTDTLTTRAFHPVFRNFGVYCVTAIGNYLGFNQEDSAVANRASLERGALQTTRTLSEKNLSKKGSGSDKQHYGKINPKNTTGMKTANYSKITSNGLPSIGEHIEKGDVIIGKSNNLNRDRKTKSAQYRCTSVTHTSHPGIVADVICTSNAESQSVRKITIRSNRMAELGDKISFGHGQKTTIGFIANQEDMLFDPATGVPVDLIVPTTFFPSRMTFGILKEMDSNLRAAITGVVQDGTAFRGFENNDKDKYGLLGHGVKTSKRLRDGRTGKLIKSKITAGLVLVNVLKQFSADKIHARARGPRNILTRGPLEGRARNGGQKCGEMARDCFQAYGVSAVMHSRMLLHADVSIEYFCKRCGFKAIANVDEHQYRCQACGPHGVIREVSISRAFSVLLDELQALMISVRVELNDVEPAFAQETMDLLDSIELNID